MEQNQVLEQLARRKSVRAYTGEPVRADSERIYVVARECQKMCGADTCCDAIGEE